MKRIGKHKGAGAGWAIFLRKESRIAREHEVKLLIGEASAFWEKAGVLQAIELHRPYAVVQIACGVFARSISLSKRWFYTISYCLA